MSNELDLQINQIQPMVYQIRVKSHLGSEWTDWFAGMTISLQEEGDTLLTGPVVDQAALHGLLKKVRDLGMSLVSVNQMEPVPADAENAKQEMNNQIKGKSEETYESRN